MHGHWPREGFYFILDSMGLQILCQRTGDWVCQYPMTSVVGVHVKNRGGGGVVEGPNTVTMTSFVGVHVKN